MIRYPSLLMLLLAAPCTTALAQISGDAKQLAAIYSADGPYEYVKDGAAPIGFVTLRMENGKVKFTMCDNKTVEVQFSDLRAAKGRCDKYKKDQGNWLTNANADVIAPLYRHSTAPVSSTVVTYAGKPFDIKSVPGWEKKQIKVPSSRDDEPVGFLFKDADGNKAVAILEGEPEPNR